MSHHASRKFWIAYDQLPQEVRELADRCYELLEKDPKHPSLRLKRVGKYWLVRVGRGHRAVAVEIADGFLWVWIGAHDDYDRFIRE